MKALACSCGDCTHWEILDPMNTNQILKCKSCGREYNSKVEIEGGAAARGEIKVIEVAD